eukprot:TRINITY_DN9681_c0_g1_i1.p1 TRINITY_DN9681_c0_g1~~TRINITY_DN9681_c0_g1_i1.p1  ORF type:complete len:192 (+),score=39.15 TRINITY_DN9681_c0_g1_i1:22-597(+)
MFGVVVPSRPPILSTSFRQIEQTQFVVDIADPCSVREVVLFLMSPCLPEGMMAGLYISFPQVETFPQQIVTKWQLISGVSNSCPSSTQYVFWSDEEAALLRQANCAQLLLSIEPEATLQEKLGQRFIMGDHLQLFARGIAVEIFNYLGSFAKMTPQGDLVILESSALDKWFKRFQEKYKHDPNYIMSLIRK